MTTFSKYLLASRSALLAFTLIAFTGLANGEDEPALFIAWGDEDLEWVPCPDFFAAGCQLSFIHGDPANPSADVLFKVPGGYNMVSHWHHSAERMVLMNGEMAVVYKGQEEVNLKQGMYMYGPSERPHHGKCISEEPCVLFVGFVGPVDAMATATEAH
jgi:mannose-6-phosphate isomerase-like protein (cupin superfamily)